MSIIVAGFSNSNKVPGFYAQTKFGAGSAKFGAAPTKVLVCGLKTSAGSIVPDVDVTQVFSPEECDALGGPGSEVALGGRAALLTPGVEVYLCSPTSAAGSAGTATITITGTFGAAGTLELWIAGVFVEVLFQATDNTVTLAAVRIVNAINANTQLPVTAANAAGVVTITSKQTSIRANQILVAQEFGLVPSGMTSTLAGGAALVANKLVPLTGGAGVETLTNMLATLFAKRHNYNAIAQNDATSLAAWETQSDAKAGSTEGRTEHSIVFLNTTLSAATSIAQSTLNNQRFQVGLLVNGETTPFQMSCAFAAQRASAEAVNPNQGYDNVKILGARGQRYAADIPNFPTKLAALDNGVSICMTNGEGDVVMVRAITSRSLNGSQPDYSTLDTAQAIVADYTRDRMEFVWRMEFLPQNKYVRDDPSPREKALPAGQAYPRLWSSRVMKELLAMQSESIITAVEQNPPASELNDVAKRIQSAIPAFPLPIQHQIGVVVSQLQSAA